MAEGSDEQAIHCQTCEGYFTAARREQTPCHPRIRWAGIAITLA